MSTRTAFGKVELWEDFLLSADHSGWNDNTENSGTAAQLANVEDGYINLVTGASSGNRSQITGERVWRAESGGPLVFEAGFRPVTDIAAKAFFIGFTDVTTIENPIESNNSANTVLTNASDGVGFFYDTRMDDDVWWMAGVDSDTDATHAAARAVLDSTNYLPIADTDQSFRIVIDAAGEAEFFINQGQQFPAAGTAGWTKNGISMDGATSPNVNLCPTIVVETQENSAQTVYGDYIYCCKGRNP